MVRTAPQVAATKEELHRVQSQSQSAAAAENRAQGALEKAKVELRQAQADAALRTVQQHAERTAAEPTGRRGPISGREARTRTRTLTLTLTLTRTRTLTLNLTLTLTLTLTT